MTSQSEVFLSSSDTISQISSFSKAAVEKVDKIDTNEILSVKTFYSQVSNQNKII